MPVVHQLLLRIRFGRAFFVRSLWLLSVLMGNLLLTKPSQADLVEITNAGFEDVTGQNEYNEFTFGVPVGWSLYDPDNIVPDPGTFTGTLEPNGVDFFNSTAPEGVKVSILFNSGREGEGAYGYEQTLSAALEANTRYTLMVDIGNIASGTAQDGQFFNLDEFPGYRVELLAGGEVIAADDNTLSIAEGEFATTFVTFDVGMQHDQLSQDIGIRLLNLNELPEGYSQATSPDLEVDFDNVRLDTIAVPEPSHLGLLSSVGISLLAFRRRRRSAPVERSQDRS